MTIFGSFEIGRKALRAQHKGMEVSGQNVANANTPGYSRQRANLESVEHPIVADTSMAPGQGVRVSDVERMHSEFYHSQLINTASHKKYWDMRQETYKTAEAVFMEPDDYGINKYLTEFFDSWQELSSSPEEAAVRSGLREHAVTLTHSVQDVYSRLQDIRNDKQDELEMRVDEVNRILDEISEINDKLRFVDALQQKSNELHDHLDQAIEELAELVDIQVHRKGSGAVDIFSGGQLLVQENRAFHLDVEAGAEGQLQVTSNRGFPLQIEAGRINGLLDAINIDIPDIQHSLDNVVTTLVEDVNELHRAGYGLDHTDEVAMNFFAPLDEERPASLQFRVADDILEDNSNIAASAEPGEPGNGEIALDIARLRDHREDDRLQGTSIMEYYRGMVTSMGVQAQESERMAETFKRTEGQIQELHRSVSGVNIDEEMLNMTQFQHAWQAAARYLNTVDEMLTVLFTELGR